MSAVLPSATGKGKRQTPSALPSPAAANAAAASFAALTAKLDYLDPRTLEQVRSPTAHREAETAKAHRG